MFPCLRQSWPTAAITRLNEKEHGARGSFDNFRRNADERRRDWANAAANRRREEAPGREVEEENEENAAFHPDWIHNPDDYVCELSLLARRAINAQRAAQPADRPAARKAAYLAMDDVFFQFPDEKPEGWDFGSETFYPWHIAFESVTGPAWPLPKPPTSLRDITTRTSSRTSASACVPSPNMTPFPSNSRNIAPILTTFVFFWK